MLTNEIFVVTMYKIYYNFFKCAKRSNERLVFYEEKMLRQDVERRKWTTIWVMMRMVQVVVES